jgi:hypothetical protein
MSGGSTADDDDDEPGEDETESDDGDGAGGGDTNGGGGGSFPWIARGCSASGPIGESPLSWIAFSVLALVLRRRTRHAT